MIAVYAPEVGERDEFIAFYETLQQRFEKLYDTDQIM